MKELKVLGVHGLGDHRGTTWAKEWEEELGFAIPGQDSVKVIFKSLSYDPIFEKIDISTWDTAKALWKLAGSAVTSALPGQRGILGNVSDRIRWTAGYVVAWVEDAEFQKQTRKLVLDAIRREKPDVILAHSLGSLITYNAFSHPDAQESEVQAILRAARYVTLGCQIGNPFVVKNLTPGRIAPLDVHTWYNLFNIHDSVFTAPIRIWGASNFEQVDTPFDIDGIADHSATEYLGHANTVENVWRPLVEQSLGARALVKRKAMKQGVAKAVGRRNRRALLVGINNYPDAANRLEGCVNDVFLMSSVLQECGFEPESIRVCLDERATAEGILSRLEWLLDDPQPEDERIFYYSGHGAYYAEYGEDNEPDRRTETLVPWDFDWTPETSITDDQIWMLYSQLPYDTRLAMIFDCCHSGGIHRDGGGRVRGLTPPDDIRHRELKWDLKTKMWVQRDFTRINDKFGGEKNVKKAYFGQDGSTARIGRASQVRGLTSAQYAARMKATTKPVGPYLPLIIEACGEEQYSYEYRHGATSYGAFTYSLSSILREGGKNTFGQLLRKTSVQLKDLGYDQLPQILGPGKIVNAQVPWLEGKKKG